MIGKMMIFVVLMAFAMVEARDPKFIFVSSTTSTSVSTTTSMISATITCLELSKTAYKAACSGRKRRASIIDDEGFNVDLDIAGSKIARDPIVPEVEDSNNKAAQSGREARFAWYYMTTTLTAVSTSTATSTTTVSTISVSALACTPTTYIGCGK